MKPTSHHRSPSSLKTKKLKSLLGILVVLVGVWVLLSKKRRQGEEKPRKVYFAGSIRGGREDRALYENLIGYIKRSGFEVLTEHIGKPSLEAMGETGRSEEYIYERDMAWLKEATVVVAEVTQPSLGVGYELAAAEGMGIPTLCLYRGKKEGKSLSAMIRGNQYFYTVDYVEEMQARQIISNFLSGIWPNHYPQKA
mmetsp:Transcript_5781/g.9376  ORF Transcript_5781/g.9376 Transcript_5781/m.9376 type:complete len:196 (-) Transcript_5781:123-710(-)